MLGNIDCIYACDMGLPEIKLSYLILSCRIMINIASLIKQVYLILCMSA